MPWRPSTRPSSISAAGACEHTRSSREFTFSNGSGRRSPHFQPSIVNRRAKVTPDRRAMLTPPVGFGGLIHALSMARVPH